MDPKCFSNDTNQNYELNKKSNVYSIGILMWQISSGYKPFEGQRYNPIDIQKGKREEIIYGTPIKYSDLYQGK